MTDEQRKASDILLDLESKVDKLLGVSETNALNYKLVNNKLNEIMTLLTKQAAMPVGKPTAEAPKPTIQVSTHPLEKFQPIDPERQVPVFATNRIPQTNAPSGFSRTSRQETFDPAAQEPTVDFPQYDQQKPAAPTNLTARVEPKFPTQIVGKPPPGRGPGSEVMSAPLPPKQTSNERNATEPREQQQAKTMTQNAIPVYQRITDAKNKSIFLADVEIIDRTSGETVHKTRTAATGKWQAALPVGEYKVMITKREGLNKDKPALQSIQDITIDGTKSPLEIAMIAIR